ncbi:hypothetical protein RRG08_047890 [Elysia crispata]|uniref:EGF-like domain-containing protein n=1 Tax=Elysia crispata TaxID=231223 RepID=A0AAE0ZLE8_9GAST|nr:hypothetical protein RRG08_047890 [Elysia crispata]
MHFFLSAELDYNARRLYEMACHIGQTVVLLVILCLSAWCSKATYLRQRVEKVSEQKDAPFSWPLTALRAKVVGAAASFLSHALAAAFGGSGFHPGENQKNSQTCIHHCYTFGLRCKNGAICEAFPTEKGCKMACRKADGGKKEERKKGAGSLKSFLKKNNLIPVTFPETEDAKDKSKKSHICDDQCNIFSSRCKEGTMCVTITTETGCDMKCRAPDGSETDLGSHISTVPPSTLRPLSERRCKHSDKECTHGTCKDGFSCTCDRGYKGELCSKQECNLCSHGVCYFKSPRVLACDCDPGWGGPFCHEPYCSRKCKNGGSCIWDVKPKPSMICTCRDPWIGDYCERMRSTRSPTNILPKNTQAAVTDTDGEKGSLSVRSEIWAYKELQASNKRNSICVKT